MNRSIDLDLVLRVYLADDGLTAPDRVLHVVEERIGRQPQRRAWRLLGRPFMTRSTKVAFAAAALVIVAVVGWQLLPRSTGVGPAPSPSPSSAPTPSAAAIGPSPTSPQCEDLIAGCAGVLGAGSHRTSNFAQAFSYTTPAGWINSIDAPTLVALTTAWDRPDPILVWSNIVPADRGADCVLKAKAGAASGVDGWVTYLTTHPGLVTSSPTETTLNGNRAVVIDVQSDLAWVTPCSDDAPTHTVPIIRNVGNAPGDGYGTAEGGRVRLYIVGVGSTTVLVTIYSYGGGDAAFTALLPEVEPVVQSFTFIAPAPSATP